MHSRLQVLTRVIKLCNEVEGIFESSSVTGSEAIPAPYNPFCAGFTAPSRCDYLLGWCLDIRETHISIEVFISWGDRHNPIIQVRCDQILLPSEGGLIWKAKYCFATKDASLQKLADTWDLAPNRDFRVISRGQAFAIIRTLVDFYTNLSAVKTAITAGG